MSNNYTSKYHGYLGIPGEGDGIRVFLDNETDNLISNLGYVCYTLPVTRK